MSSMTFSVEEIKKKLNDIQALMNNTLYITVKTDGFAKHIYSYTEISGEKCLNFQNLINKSPIDFNNIEIIEIEIYISYKKDFDDSVNSSSIDFSGLKDIGLSNKYISVTITKNEDDKYDIDAEAFELSKISDLKLPNIKTDVIFNELIIHNISSIKNQPFPYTRSPITKNLSVHNCRFNDSITFFSNTNSYENAKEREKFNYPSIRFENNIFEERFLLQSIAFKEKFIFIENTFKKNCKIQNNEFKENFEFEKNNVENELYLINNKFKKDCKLSNNTFKEVLDLSSSSFAGALYLANSTFKEGIITYNIKFISSDTGKKISPEEYTNNCFVDINFDNLKDSDIENLNNFRLSAGIIKSNLINSHNKIDASIWLAVELFIQTKILSLSKCKTLKDFGEWVVFSMSGLVSNHQQNIMRPFGWLIAIFLVTSIVYNLNTSILLPNYSFNFSSPLDFINPFLQNYEIPKKSSSFGFGLKLLKILVNAFVAYIIWHIIQTSRSKIK